jgi:hypothetical protein
VSRDSSLRALRGALEGAANGVAVLVGPTGPTRAIVLQALVEELGTRFPSASLRRPTLPPGGLWMELAARLDLDGGYDAKRRILRLAGELSGQGRGILVVVDGADALPGESLYGLLEVARSELGFYLLLGWPNEGAARALPDDLFVVTLEGTAVIPAPAFLASPDAAPPEPPADVRSAELPRFADPIVRRPEAARSPEPLVEPTIAAEPAPRPRFAARPLYTDEPAPPRFAAPPPHLEELPVRPRAARGGTLQPAAWIASGLAIGLLVGAYLGSGQWRAIGEADAPLDIADRGAVYNPASEPPAPFDPEADLARRAARRAAEAAARAPRPAAPPAAGVPEPAPAPRAAAPALAETAQPAGAAPAGDVAAAPAPTPDVSAPPPAAAEAPPLEPRDLVPNPEPAPVPEFSRRDPRAGPPAEGRLTVRSESPVMVEVDGHPFGPAPLKNVRLARGEHRVIAKYADGSVALKTIYLASDDVAVSFR